MMNKPLMKNISWCSKWMALTSVEFIHVVLRVVCIFSSANLSILVLSVSLPAWALVYRKLVPLLYSCGGAVCPSKPCFRSWPGSTSSWLQFTSASQSVTKRVCKSVEWFTHDWKFSFSSLMFSLFLFIHQEPLKNCRYSALFSESFTVLIKILSHKWTV